MIIEILNNNSVFFENIGNTQKEYLFLEDEFNIHVDELRKLNNNWFEDYTN